MRRIFSAIIILLWGFWFGGLLQLFLMVTHLFQTMARNAAGMVASGMFQQFDKERLIIAGALLVAILIWYDLDKTRSKMTVFVLVAFATCIAAASTTLIVPQLEKLREQNMTQEIAFKQLHGDSMIAYMSEESLLLLAALFFPAGMAPKKLEPKVEEPLEEGE